MSPDAPKMPPKFDPTSKDQGWGRIESAYDLAGLMGGPPVGVQVILKNAKRSINTGFIIGTQDQMRADDTIEKSIIYFRDADGIAIDWAQVAMVLAMVAQGEDDE